MVRKKQALSDPASSLNLSRYLTWIASIVLCCLALLSIAIWNNFPLVFFDTGGYIRRALVLNLMPGRSLFYGLYLWVFSFGWKWLWGPVVGQALFTVWLIQLVLRCNSVPSTPLGLTLMCFGLSLFTGIAWCAGQLMPDALLSLIVLSLLLLGFFWEKLRPLEKFGIIIIAIFSLLSHMSGMALAIGLVIVVFIAFWLSRIWKLSVKVSIFPPLAVVGSSFLLMPLLHLLIVGQFTYTPGGPVYIFGRLVQSGIAQRWLAEHCPIPGIKLCNLQSRIPANGDEFLWSGTSPFKDLGGWSGKADAELGYLSKACIYSYPGEMVITSLQATGDQLVMVKSGDQFGDVHNDTRNVFSNLLPKATGESFNAARQQQGEFTKSLLTAVNDLHVPVAYISMISLILISIWSLRNGNHHLAISAIFVILALLGNAFICGALSNPHDRYQSRLVWLATFVLGMAMVELGQKRRQTRSL